MSAARSGGGYWIDPEETDSAPVPPLRSDAEALSAYRPSAQPRPVTRRRALFWTGLVVVTLAVLGILAALMLMGEVVVPGISAKLFPIQYQEEIRAMAEKYDQDPYLVAAIVKAESGYDPTAASSSGAVGLMQLMPATAEWVASQSNEWPEDEAPVLTDAGDSLELGVWYLAYLGDIYGDGSLAALAAYNGGLGNVDEWIEEAGGLQSFETSHIRFPETKEYVERIEHYLELYRQIHPAVFSQPME